MAVSWTSSLSVDEMVAIHQAGFHPCGQVMGSSVYQVGQSFSPQEYWEWYQRRGGPMGGGPFGGGGGPFGGNGPFGGGGYGAGFSFPGWMRTYSANTSGSLLGGPGMMVPSMAWERLPFEEGLEAAAHNAVERMLDETRQRGGHGVIGTRLTFRWVEVLTSSVEFVAVGTAIARAGQAPLDLPFTSHLSGTDLLKLISEGLVPVQVGVGVGSVGARAAGLMMGTTAEVIPYREAVEKSWELAEDRLRASLGDGAIDGIGTSVSTATLGEGDERVHNVVLISTGVQRFGQPDWPAPLPIMRLSK